MEKDIFIWVGAVLVSYFLFKTFIILNRQSNVVKKEINEIINSDKYKAKGQYDN